MSGYVKRRRAIASTCVAIGSALVVLVTSNPPAFAQDRNHERFDLCMQRKLYAGHSDGVEYCRGWAPCETCPDIAGLPPGSWRQSCKADALDGKVLTAHCRSGAGPYVITSIDVGACTPAKLRNDDGHLKCE